LYLCLLRLHTEFLPQLDTWGRVGLQTMAILSAGL